MSTDPATAPFRTAYVRGTDGLYYKIGGADGGGGGGEDEVHVGATPPAGPFPGQMWVDLTGSGGGETDVYADEVYVGSVPPVTPFNGQMWVDLTGEGDGSTGINVDEVHVGDTPPPAPFDGQMWVDLTGQGPAGSSGIISGLWMSAWPYTTFATLARVAGTGLIFRLATAQSFKTVQIDVTTAATGGKCRVGVYADTSTGPGTLQVQTTDIDCSVAGVRQAALAIPIGTSWQMLQNTGSATCTFRTAVGENPLSTGFTAPGTGATQSAWSNTGLGTTLPTTWPTAGQTVSVAPAVYLQAT